MAENEEDVGQKWGGWGLYLTYCNMKRYTRSYGLERARSMLYSIVTLMPVMNLGGQEDLSTGEAKGYLGTPHIASMIRYGGIHGRVGH